MSQAAGFSIDAFSAVRHGRKDDVASVIENGFPLDSQNKYGNTLVHIAVQNNHKRILKTLLRSGAKVDIKNGKGMLPIDYASKYKYYHLMKYIIPQETKTAQTLDSGDIMLQI